MQHSISSTRIGIPQSDFPVRMAPRAEDNSSRPHPDPAVNMRGPRHPMWRLDQSQGSRLALDQQMRSDGREGTSTRRFNSAPLSFAERHIRVVVHWISCMQNLAQNVRSYVETDAP
jgi:hypothetical protein